MSFLAASFGAADDTDLVRRLLGLSGVRSAAGRELIDTGGGALGTGRTIAEANRRAGASSRQAPRSGLCVAWEGRLDNGHDLIAELHAPPDQEDAAVILLAWERWGSEAAHRLHGDFCFVVYDPSVRAGWAVRDALGVKPLYWALTGRHVAFASEARVLAQALDMHAPDEVSVVRTLAGRPVETDGTLYADIRPVRAGSVLTFNVETGSRTRRTYWAPDPWRELDPRGAATRPEQLRAVLKTAVTRRMADRTRVAITASGGLDSSAVAGVAVSAARELGQPLPELLAVAYPGLPCDESFYQKALAAHLAAPLVSVDAPLDGYVPSAAADVDLFEVCVVPYAKMCREALSRGLDVLLTGEGSDELQCAWGNELADALVRRDTMGAMRFAGILDSPTSPRRWRTLAGAALRVALGRDRSTTPQVPEWLSPRARKLLADADADARREAADRFSHPSPLRQSICAELTLGTSMTYSLSWNQTFFARQGIDLRHPFLDREVAELLLALPTGERTSFDLIKPTLRRAVERDLPPMITWRRALSGYAELQRRVFSSARGAWLPLANDMALADVGLVDERRFRDLLNDWGDEKWSRWDVQGTLEVESWLRSSHRVRFEPFEGRAHPC